LDAAARTLARFLPTYWGRRRHAHGSDVRLHHALAPEVIVGRAATAIGAFVTPIVAFFATILIIAVVFLVPLLVPSIIGSLLVVVGIGGILYIFSTGVLGQWRKWHLGVDDWVWYIGLPVFGYSIIVASAIGMWLAMTWATYCAASGVVILLVVGVRNAWDTVLAVLRETKHKDQHTDD
jgi:hypothetical protein